MPKEILQGRREEIKDSKDHVKVLEFEFQRLKNREGIIKNCGFQHRVPYEFFQLDPEEFDKKISSLYYDEGIITIDEYISYFCKKNNSDTPFSSTIHHMIFGF